MEELQKKIQKVDCFPTSIYYYNYNDWISSLNSVCDQYIDISKKKYKDRIINGNDFGLNYSSEFKDLSSDERLNEFKNHIFKTSFDILDEQGYNMSLYNLALKHMWVQEFPKSGGGHHNSHVHSNSNISGFYFLKCSEKTSYPLFHDCRIMKKMTQLIEKNRESITNASEQISFGIQPGMFIFFNSYLEHQFTLDNGKDEFRFIHFNIQAIEKSI